MGAKLHVLTCKATAKENVEFDAVKSVLPPDMQALLGAQGRLLIVAESADTIATPEKAK